ncbi:MAG TPA: CBS domain-containing protein [Vicinamibacterales bacterium]|nr:CBS domain-containing protein [Vicinamibacterales bacterium]
MTIEQRLARAFLEQHPSDAALALERIPFDRRASVLREAPAESARALALMVTASAAESLSHLTDEEAAPVLEALPLDTTMLLLRRMPVETAGRLVRGLPRDKQEWLGRALRYPEGTAGALMDPAVLPLPDDIAIAEARARVRRHSAGRLDYLFVVDRTGRLAGVLDLAELMRAPMREPLRAMMHAPVVHLPAWTPAPAVRLHAGWRTFHALPVTDEEGRLVGTIHYETLRRLEQEADGGEDARLTTQTVSALGELFHLGMAGMIESVATVAKPAGERGAR